jgi:Holliday junction resolvasome RuvABC endonuclease subunit
VTHIFLGVDPGIHGALALIEIREDGPHVVDAIDIPTIGAGAKERVNVHAMQEWVLRHRPFRAFIERAQALPKQGASSGYKYGRSVGALEATIALCNVPFEIVEPSMWKHALRLKGKDKEGSRQKALQMFPRAAHLLTLKRHHQRAEAMLIGYFGAWFRMLVKPTPVEPSTTPRGTDDERAEKSPLQ